MPRTGAVLVFVPLTACLLAVVGCSRFGRYEHYAPAPLTRATDAPVVAAMFLSRRLDAPTLTSFLARQGAPVDGRTWTPRQLALASLYFHPSLGAAYGLVGEARAAEVTAGARPDLGTTLEVDRVGRVDEGKTTPWSATLAGEMTLELGGKRQARVARARAATLAARLGLGAAAWERGSEAQLAAAEALAAEAELTNAEAEARALTDVLTLVRARFAEGRVSLADVAQAEADVRGASVSASDARRGRTEARLTLARALAVPLRAVDSVSLRADSASACDATREATYDSAGARALTGRADVGAAVAEYAVAEAELRVEVARQYPDLTIGPGLGWEQGVGRWVLSLGLPNIPRQRNRGPIAEALARRVTQATRVAAIQDSVLGAVDAALAACRDARRARDVATGLVESTERALRLARAAYDRGEIGRTEIAFAQLALVRARRTATATDMREQRASATLETALGVWSAPAPRWPDPLDIPRLAGDATPATDPPGGRPQ